MFSHILRGVGGEQGEGRVDTAHCLDCISPLAFHVSRTFTYLQASVHMTHRFVSGALVSLVCFWRPSDASHTFNASASIHEPAFEGTPELYFPGPRQSPSLGHAHLCLCRRKPARVTHQHSAPVTSAPSCSTLSPTLTQSLEIKHIPTFWFANFSHFNLHVGLIQGTVTQ